HAARFLYRRYTCKHRHSAKHPQQLVVKVAAQKQGLAPNAVGGLLRKHLAAYFIELKEDLVGAADAGVHFGPQSPRPAGLSVGAAHHILVLAPPGGMRVADLCGTVEVKGIKVPPRHLVVGTVKGCIKITLVCPEGH